MAEKSIIVGAGIAGLSAGCYGRMDIQIDRTASLDRLFKSSRMVRASVADHDGVDFAPIDSQGACTSDELSPDFGGTAPYLLTISTRRFFARPSSLRLSAIGFSCPQPTALKRFAATPPLTTAFIIDLARCSLSDLLL